MNKADLVRSVARNAGISVEQSKRIVEVIFDGEEGVIASAIGRGQTLTIAGFGVFEPLLVPQHTGHNPRNGEKITVPARRRPRFRPGKQFKETVAI